MQQRILSFHSLIPKLPSLNSFKQQLPRFHPQPPFRHFPDHHNRHNSSKIKIMTIIKALSSKILTPTNKSTFPSSLSNNKTYTSPEEIKGSTTKTIQTTQVATSTITTTTISETKVITKTNLSSMPPSSSSSSSRNHNITIPLNKYLTQQQVSHGNKM